MNPREMKHWKPRSQFRVLVAGVTIDPPGATYGPRTRQNYEFIWIMEGEATAQYDRKVIEAGEGTLLLRRAGVSDYYEWSPKRRTVHAYVHFDLDAKRKKILSASSVPSHRLMPPNDILRPLFSYLLNLDAKKEPRRTQLMLPTLDLMLQSYVTGEVASKPQPPSQLPPPVEKAVEFIRVRCAKTPPPPLRLKEVAQEAGTTPENLCRIFQKALEVGPLEYAKLARLDRAANQLRRTSLGLKEIAQSTGFYDAYHFSRSFKQVYGLAPKEFRGSAANEWISQKNPIIRTLYSRSTPDAPKGWRMARP